MILIITHTVLGLLYPFFGTVFGSSFVFFMKKRNPEKAMMVVFDGLAAGVMCAASYFSLISPACESAEKKGIIPLLLCSVGFFFGMGVFILTDVFLNKCMNGYKDKSSKMLFWAVTIHNIPEGMAVGIVWAGLLFSYSDTLLAGAVSLSVGIALQNIPEGAIISLPLKAKSKGTFKSFLYGVYSGIAELCSGIITLFLSSYAIGILPFFMCFAAGAMFFVVMRELSADFSEEQNGRKALLTFAVGFTVMMLLDTLVG